MANASKQDIARAVLSRHGETYASRLHIRLERGTPSPLFRWLCASILFSARISEEIAMKAADNLSKQGWRTARRLAESTWRQRVKALNEVGYARYDESTSRMLGEVADLLLKRYKGDLRKLRDEAGREPARERELLKEFKGLGDVGVDIFFREMQSVWPEIYPFADKRALGTAHKLHLGNRADELARLVSRSELPRLVAGLVSVAHADDYDAIRQVARAA